MPRDAGRQRPTTYPAGTRRRRATVSHLLERLDQRRLAISLAAGLLAGALTAAIAIPATSPSLLDAARAASPVVDAAP